jgi:hypothetical protein
MSDPLPRDVDGYVDLEALPEDAVDLDLAALAPVEPLPDEAWEALVAAAPHTDPEATGIDTDALVDDAPTSGLDGTDPAQDGGTGAAQPEVWLPGDDASGDGDGTWDLVGEPGEPGAHDISDTTDWDT